MAINFTFQEAHFNRIFPFYILVNQQMVIESNGKTLEKIFAGIKGKSFDDNFSIKRPKLNALNFESLKSLDNQLLVIECLNEKKINLRGQLDYLPETNQILFLGSPWFDSIEDVIENKLSLHDFAFHDSMTDLLHVMKTHENTNDDLKYLLKKINSQKDDLKNANKEIHDIALFPTQNPDPMMRINFEGDLLQNNPAAAQLDFIAFENKLYRNDEFFKLITERIDKNEKRWTIEASSDEREYSFACITMKDEGYINIYGRDITQQKKDQEELQKLSYIIQQTINAVIITDAKGKIEWVNNAFEKVTGFSINDVKGKSPGSMLQGKETDPETVQYMRQQIQKAEAFTCEIFNYKKSGEGYWLRINGQPIFNKSGQVVQFFAIEEDITKEREAQAKLKEFDERINLAMQKIGDNVWEHNFITEQTSFSQQEYNLLGYSSDEFNSNVDLWYESIYKEDKKLVTANDLKYRSGLIDHHSLEYRMIHADGTIKWVLDRGVVIEKTKDNKPLKIIGTHTDITNIKNILQRVEQSEKKYRDVIDNSLAIVTTHDLNGNFISVNPVVGKIYGYKDEEMIGHSLTEFMPAEDKPLFEIHYMDKIKQEKQASGIFRVLHKDGKIIYSLYNNFLKEEPGEEPYVIGFAVDITERIQAEKQLKIAKKITEEIAQTKQNFLANMSHEIRTPMNAIMGMTNQLNKTALSKDQQFYLNVIHSASDNLLIIINDILDLSKIEAGKLTIENIGFEPQAVIGRAMQVMVHRAEEKGLNFTNSFCDSGLSPVLLGDPYRLNQVLLNLISNAIKFTAKGTVDITCRVLEDTIDKQKIEATVTDTGIGMDESFAKNLFEKFSQEDDSTTRKYGGTGLGMSICKELVSLMGGEIKVTSKKGVGTSISFIIELQKGTAKDLPVKEITQTDTKVLAGKKILVTDDNEMNQLVAATMLKNYGAEITEAFNGQEAIDKIKANHFDIVLMDVQMPVMDGLEATRIIRATISKDLPVVALTAFAIKGDNDKCMDAGMNDYLTKPFEESQLLNIVSKWLGKAAPKENAVAENVTITESPLYDLSKLQDIARGNKAFIDKMVNLFIEQIPPAVKEMQDAYEEKNYETIKKIAHRIKPSIHNMGISSLKTEIREIETLALENQNSSKLLQLIQQLHSTLKIVIEALKSNHQ